MSEIMTFQQLREIAKYIDHGVEVLSAIASQGVYPPSESASASDYLDSLSSTIAAQREEIERLNKLLNNVADFPDLLKNSASILSVLKQYTSVFKIKISTDPEEPLNDVSSPAQPEPKYNQLPTPSPVIHPQINTPVSIDSGFRMITEAEFKTLPNITQLLIRYEDINKHYTTLHSSVHDKLTAEEISELVPLSASRLDAFLGALVSLKRMSVDDSVEPPVYTFGAR